MTEVGKHVWTSATIEREQPRRPHLCRIALASVVVSVACNPCHDAICPAESHDAFIGCTSNADCAGATPACSVERNTCVQCTATDNSTCTASAPVCGIDDTCRRCLAHTDCQSNACLPNGACGDDTIVAYVDPSGGTTGCTRRGPCARVDDALRTGRGYIKLHGVISEQIYLNGGTVSFLADPGAMLTETQAGSVLKIAGATHLAIYDLEIYGAFGPSNAGILLQTGNAATVDLVRATVRGGTGVGILADGGTLNISQTTIVDNGGGGISLTGSSFRIVNNIIARNGNFSSSQIGGVSVQGFASGSRLDFNTIVANYSTFEQTSAGGVRCDRPGFTSTGNLIFRNVGGPQANVQTVGACQHSNSYINPGTSLADNEPMFVNPNVLPFDYHLTENSPANIIDAGGKCPSGDFDIDGDARPSGAECDVGADELIRR